MIKSIYEHLSDVVSQCVLMTIIGVSILYDLVSNV